ncbi:MAG TPA: L-histidine N(alpha)-methyltransferase [Candidatus Saccharimonadales bacterium]|jgi:L-histidine N-alpha-methyltransferase|nr:L-histidine N(alpha)-methyltransferase [Candidatus Saccharimonadales bacterium]
MTATRDPAALTSPIAEDVLLGLSAQPKRLPPKLFYDAEGSRLFEQITETPEYYPTRTERAIFQEYAAEIISQAGSNLTVVELGAGSASKTAILLQALLRCQLRADFYPVDVSPSALQGAMRRLKSDFPCLHVSPIVADYSQHLPDLKSLPGRRLVLFTGSSIGNFESQEAEEFLQRLRVSLQTGDALLIGFDLSKDAGVLHAAYNDAQGVTAAFNKNLLARIDRELGGDFDLSLFQHVAFWNRQMSRIEMHLESLSQQTVRVHDLRRVFHFAVGERIHTENSYKFSSGSIARLFRASGYRLEKSWTDPNQWFSVALARV